MRGQGDRETRIARLLPLASCFWLLASCLPAPTSVPTLTPTAIPTPTLFPTSTPTVTPAPTHTPTPVPTPGPADVATIVAAGQVQWEKAGAAPLCLRWEDTDNDGQAEWVGLYEQPGEPPQLAAFVLDGEAWHALQPLDKEKHGLGEYPTCELEMRDVNADGRVEILVWGHAEVSTDLLHIFVWDGTTYMLLAAFEGDAGLRLENTDGDLADEVIVGYKAGSDLVWEAVYTWDGANYGWTWERYGWFYLDRPHAYHTDTPEHAVISFYLAVDDRDLPGAYGLLGAGAQAAQAAEGWMADFATTVAVEVGVVHELTRSQDVATVIAQVRAYDNVDGRIVATVWDVKWTVVQTPDGWRLESVTTEQLERWEVGYYR